MPELTDDELRAKVEGDQAPTPLPMVPAVDVAAMGTTVTSRNAPPEIGDTRRTEQALGEQPGIPFHEEGLPTWDDIMVKARNNTEDQLRYLTSKYGKDNVRLNDLQEPVLRIVNPKTGNPEDYPVNPHRMTWDSITGLAAMAPEVVGAALALKLGGSGAGLLKQSILGALGQEAGAAWKERETKASDFGPDSPEAAPGRILAENLSKAPVDTGANLLVGGALKLGQTAAGLAKGKGFPNPLAKTRLFGPSDPELTGEGVQAANRLSIRSGIQPKLTVAEATGIPAFAMGEVYAASKPASASQLLKQTQASEQYSKDLQNWMVQPQTLGTDEQVGRRGLAILKDWLKPFKDKVAALKERLGLEANLDTEALQASQNKSIADTQLDLVNKLGAGDIPIRGVDKTSMGDSLASKYLGARKAFRDTEKDLYEGPNGVESDPKFQEPIVSGQGLQDSLMSLKNSLPKVVKTEKQIIYSPNWGGPMETDVEKTVPIDSPIRPRLEELTRKLENGKVSLHDLKALRTDIGNAIEGVDPLTGVKEGRLKNAYASVSKAIDEGLKEINDQALTAKWDAATKYHADNVEKFTGKTVRPLAHDAEQSGTIGNSAFVDRLITSPDSYNAAKAFFGHGSPEMEAFLKTTRDHLLEKGLSGNSVDGEKLIASLESLRASNKELFKDALGDNGPALIAEAKQLGGFQRKLPLDEISRAMNPALPRRMTLLSMQVAEDKLAKEYQNGVVKKFLSGESPAADIEPDKFIRFLPTAKLSDVTQVMQRIGSSSPEAADQLRRKTIQTLLGEARRYPTPKDALNAIQEKPGDIVSATGLKEALGRGDQFSKYRTILGPELFSDLQDFIKVQLLGEEKRRIGAGAGMLAKGQAISGFESALKNLVMPGGKQGAAAKEIGSLGLDKVFAWILTQPGLTKWVSSPHQLANMPRTMMTIISSEPFAKGMIEEFGSPGAAYKVMATLRSGINGQRQSADDDELRAKLQSQTR